MHCRAVIIWAGTASTMVKLGGRVGDDWQPSNIGRQNISYLKLYIPPWDTGFGRVHRIQLTVSIEFMALCIAGRLQGKQHQQILWCLMIICDGGQYVPGVPTQPPVSQVHHLGSKPIISPIICIILTNSPQPWLLDHGTACHSHMFLSHRPGIYILQLHTVLFAKSKSDHLENQSSYWKWKWLN